MLLVCTPTTGTGDPLTFGIGGEISTARRG